jgi:NAD+-dependent protein deacetylase SIR2
MRTTQHLDFTSDTAQSDLDRMLALDTLLKALRKRRKIVVIAGAGISVSAGIPDFRSSHGLFRSLRAEHKLKSSGKELFDASVYKDDSSTSSFHDMVTKLSQLSQDAKPTPFHRLLARLSAEGRLLRLYTQNVDGLESKLPPLATEVPLCHKAPWPKTIQLHGGLEKMMCQKCRQISDFESTLFQGSVPPQCPECLTRDNIRTEHAGKRSHGVGRLRPRIVLYNEHNPDDEAIGAVTTADFRTRPDAVIVVGTSMKIPAVRRITAEMCKIVRDRKDGTTIWINHDPVPTGRDLEDCWDLIVKGDADEIARQASFKEWDDETPDLSEPVPADYTDAEVELSRATMGRPSIIIPSPRKEEVKQELSTLATPPRSPVPIRFSPKPNFTLNLPLVHPKMKPAASKYGKKLSDIIPKGTTTKPKQKPSTKATAKALGAPKRRKINPAQQTMTGKIVKKAPEPIQVKKEHKPEPLSPRRDSVSNVQVDPPVKKEEFSSAGSSPSPEDPPEILVATPPSNYTTLSMSPPGSGHGDTISPTGNLPKGMSHLLH